LAFFRWFSSIVARLRALWLWLWDAWPVIFGFGLPLIVLLLARLYPIAAWRLPFAREGAVRAAGFALTLFGAGGIVWDVNARREAFGKPLLPAVINYLRRFPAIFSRRRDAIAHLMGAGGGTFVALGARAKTRVGGSVKLRIDQLEQDVRDLEERLAALEARVIQAIADLRKEVAKVRVDAESASAKTNKTLKTISYDGIRVEIMVACWLILGQFFASFPAWIASWFS
jgi:hypothetical protein